MSGEENGSDLTNGEIARTLKRLDDGQKQIVVDQREGQKQVIEKIDAMTDKFIHRAEWDMQNRVHAADLADLENAARDDRKAAEVLATQVGTLEKHSSYQKGILAVLSLLFGVAVAVVTAYIQAGRL